MIEFPRFADAMKMLPGNDQFFSLARSAKKGQIELPPVLVLLRDWIRGQFGVSVVHIVYDQIEIGQGRPHSRLKVILETDSDYDAWKTDVVTIRPDIERRVLSQFRKLARNDPAYDTNDVLLIVDNFSAECLGRACSEFREQDADRIAAEFAMVPVWKIDGLRRWLVVFLETNKDIQSRTADGTCQEISKRCYEAVKKYDEFGYLNDDSFRLKFDSKENLDTNFQGSLFYYWR